MVAIATSLIAFSASAAEPCKAYVKLDLGYAKTFGTRACAKKLHASFHLSNAKVMGSNSWQRVEELE